MKGMSLALETIIILILAITVLTVLTFFFNTEFTKGKTTFELLGGQRDACAAYVRQDSKCALPGYNSVDDKTLYKLTYYCGNLGGYEKFCPRKCTGEPANCKNKASLDCVQRCCELYCPAGTKQEQSKGQLNLP